MSLAFFAVIFYLMMLLFDAASCMLFCMQKTCATIQCQIVHCVNELSKQIAHNDRAELLFE